ncbi:MAG: HEPN domain-containing protein [Clostridia bacterium]|nr:HEPN domain-containing protein [Clostridia bacterium]
MDNEEKKALAEFRIEKAKNDLSDAQKTLQLGMVENAANRSYYAIFHAARAVLALDGQDFRKHSGVIGAFSHNYIKTGIFSPAMANMIKSAFSIRSETDYEDFYVVSEADVERQVHDAESFVASVEAYLTERFNEQQNDL